MKKIVIFSGAGVSKQSSIPTFRDPVDGIYKDANIEKMVHADTLRDTPNVVYDFCNYFKDIIKDKLPNEAHKLIAKLDHDFDTTVITTNIDSLHEQAGSQEVYHLHGQLDKARSINDPNSFYPWKGDLNVGDKSPDGDELRPHVVLFEEMPYNVQTAYDRIMACDYLIIIGCSLSITYTIPMLASVKPEAKVIYIDPSPSRDLEYYFIKPEYIRLDAIKGMKKIYKRLLKEL